MEEVLKHVNRSPFRLFIIMVCVLYTSVVYAQAPLSTRNKKAIEMYVDADNLRVRGQYDQAIVLLKQAIAKDEKFFEAYLRMGIVLKTIRDYKGSCDYLEKGLMLTRELRWQKVFWVELSDNYLKLGNYHKVLAYTQQYIDNEQTNKQRLDQMQLWKASAEFSLANMMTNIHFQPQELSDSVNHFVMQYFPVITADEQEMIYTRRTGFTDEYDEDLVIVRKQADGRWSLPESVSKNINSRYNEGTCTISADGRQLIFTSCQGRRGYGNCDLFESRKIGDEWTVPVNLGPAINTAAWESQPSLSADGRGLYFVSDRRGGIGGRDIYYSYKDQNDKWVRAKNLGRAVNSIYDEISPFIHANDRTLFFASNGRPGFGGYDIFRCDRADSLWAPPVNFGYPVNDHEDQFSLFITPDSERGYYSHEEGAKENSSRIYEFKVPESLKIKYKSNVVKGIVRDNKTKEPLKARVELFNLATKEIISLTQSDSITGRYLMVLTEGSQYALYVNANGYLFKSLNFNYEQGYDRRPISIDVDLDKASAGAMVVLNNIFFEHDKYDLDPRSATELDKLVRFLRENPDIHVEISGHTDDTGTAAYNLALSQKRAQSVVDYLVSKGIPGGRLSQVGYGSKRPVFPNDTEEHKAANRRIEFRIVT